MDDQTEGSSEMSAASMAARTAELLKSSETDFDKTIQEMSLKDLLDAITSLQKEMTREQENFNSLGTELGSLNKNSQQYKQISKEMAQSQSKLTILMNRSMKCFQQQGNRQSKQKPGINQVQRRNSARLVANNDSSTNTQRRHSAKIITDEADAINSTLDKSTVKSTPNLDTSNQTKPVILKPLSTIDTTKFNLKNTETSSNKQTSSVTVTSPQTSVQQNGNSSNKSTVKMEQKASVTKISAGQSDTNPQKSVTVIKAGSSNLPKTVIQNGVRSNDTGSGQSHNMSSVSIKSPSQQTSDKAKQFEPKVNSSLPNTEKNGTAGISVLPIKVNGLTKQKPPRKMIKSPDDQPSGGNLLEQIRNFRKTSDSDDSVKTETESHIKESKTFTVKPFEKTENKVEQRDIKVVQRNSQEQKPPLIFHGGRPIVLDASVEQGRKTMLDQIKAHKRSEMQDEQIAKLEVEKKPVPLNYVNIEKESVLVAKSDPVRESQAEPKLAVGNSGKVSMATISLQRNSREVKDFVQPKQNISLNQADESDPVHPLAGTDQDRAQDEASPESEPEKFRSEFSFPSNVKSTKDKPTPHAVTVTTNNKAPQAVSDQGIKQQKGKCSCIFFQGFCSMKTRKF